MTKNCLGGLTIIVLLFISSMSGGADWVKAGESENGKVISYVDVSSISKVSSDTYSVLTKIEDINDKDVTLYDEIIDCAEKKVQILEIHLLRHDVSGASVHYGSSIPYMKPEEDGPLSKLLYFICTYKKGVFNISKREDN